MLKPEESQKIEEFIRMMEELDAETRQEAIKETNDKLEKMESVQSAPLRLPVFRNPFVQKLKNDISDFFCPHCGSHEIARNGSSRGITRLICKDCKKSFGTNYGNITYKSNYSEAKWDKYLEGLVCSDTLQQLSEKCDISLATAHNWRIKAYRTIMQAEGTIQADECYLSASFKGNKKALLNLKNRNPKPKAFPIPDYQTYSFEGHPRARGGQDTKRGLSKEKICIPTAIDETGSCIARPMGRGNVQTAFLESFFKNHLNEDIVLVTDKSKSGKSYAKSNKLSHVALDSKTESRYGTYNLQTINNFHSLLDEIATSRRSFATKYNEEYLAWISWQTRMKGLTVQEKVSALKAMAPRGRTVLVKDIIKKEFPVELRS